MARPTWTGYLGFGLVNVPIGLYSSTEDNAIHFNQFQRGTSDRIRYKKVNERTGEEVANDDIVRGVDLGGGEFVLVSPDELKSIAPEKSESIEIIDFVDLDEIDPVYFQRTYYLAPRGKGSDKAYALLRKAMEETNKVGIATFVMREKEYLVAVRPARDVLMLEVMYFADEVRDPVTEIGSLPDQRDFEDRELATAKQLITSLTADWKPTNYSSDYRERVNALIDQKRAGAVIVTEGERPKANVVSLMDALQASVERAREGRTTATSEPEVAPAKATAAPPAHEQQSFSGMSKAELLSRAAELDVKGRSKMTKEELVDALAAAERPGRSRRRAS
jgi:DNA end-binding protein Ku